MNTITLRAAVARVQALPWAAYTTRTANGLRLCWVAAQLLLAALSLAWAIAYEHRQQIRSVLVTAAAAVIVAAQLTLEAGQRLWAALLDASERLGRWYASLVAPASDEAPAALHASDEAPIALASLSNRELRELLGIRRRLSKRQLLELAAAA